MICACFVQNELGALQDQFSISKLSPVKPSIRLMKRTIFKPRRRFHFFFCSTCTAFSVTRLLFGYSRLVWFDWVVMDCYRDLFWVEFETIDEGHVRRGGGYFCGRSGVATPVWRPTSTAADVPPAARPETLVGAKFFQSPVGNSGRSQSENRCERNDIPPTHTHTHTHTHTNKKPIR